MKRLMAVALAMGLAASAYGAVGDLARKPILVEPTASVPTYPLTMSLGAPQFQAAAAGDGAVSPRAKIAMFRNVAFSIRVAVDSVKADDTAYNVIRIADAAGKFDSAQGIPLDASKAGVGGMVPFGPATVTISLSGKPSVFMVRGVCQITEAGPVLLQLSLGAVLEGQCAFGDKTYTVRCVDATYNLKMDDRAQIVCGSLDTVLSVTPGDYVLVDTGDGTFTKSVAYAYVGQPIRVDGAWWDVLISPDGTQITAEKLGMPAGRLKVSASDWTLKLAGRDRVLLIEGNADGVEVPAGRYSVISAAIRREDTSVSIAETRMAQGKAEVVEIAAGKTAELPLGPPLESRTTAAVNGRQVTFTPALVDAGGRAALSFAKGGALVQCTVQVSGADGKPVYSAAIEFT
jgi:hypothetical protein